MTQRTVEQRRGSLLSVQHCRCHDAFTLPLTLELSLLQPLFLPLTPAPAPTCQTLPLTVVLALTQASGTGYTPPVAPGHDLISPASVEDDAFAAGRQATNTGGSVPAAVGRAGPGSAAVLQFAGAGLAFPCCIQRGKVCVAVGKAQQGY